MKSPSRPKFYPDFAIGKTTSGDVSIVVFKNETEFDRKLLQTQEVKNLIKMLEAAIND